MFTSIVNEHLDLLIIRRDDEHWIPAPLDRRDIVQIPVGFALNHSRNIQT